MRLPLAAAFALSLSHSLSAPAMTYLEKRSLECRPVAGGFGITRADGVALGRPTADLDECEAAIAAARDSVVCAPKEAGNHARRWMAMHVDKGHWIGRYPVSANDCFESTRHASGGTVCGHTGLTLAGGKPGFKPTNVEKPNDTGFMGSSAWLDFCKIATANARDGIVCANGNGGTGDHQSWWRHWIATGKLVQGSSPADVRRCSEASREQRDGYVQLLAPEKVESIRRLLPTVDNAEVDELLQSDETMWYDETAIVPGYQDSMGDPRGFRPNTIENILIDLAVPGGWSRLFERRGRFNFPFATGGADRSDNFTKVNFWVPPRANGRVLPVAYWKLNFSRYRWLFPVGTRFGEVMFVKYPDGERRVFEIRVRERELGKWTNTVYRPYLESLELADMIKALRPNWNEAPALRRAVEHLSTTSTLVAGALSTKHFPGTFETVQGVVDEIPDFDDPQLAKDLLQYTTFRTVGSLPWKAHGDKKTHAASTRSRASVVPVHYDGGLLPVDDVSCRRCHKDAGRQIADFHPDLVLYGELWGEDEIFSWHPFDNAMFVDAQGNVKNFNNDNRRIRGDFTAARLVESYSPSTHPASLYKELPREWKYNPVR